MFRTSRLVTRIVILGLTGVFLMVSASACAFRSGGGGSSGDFSPRFFQLDDDSRGYIEKINNIFNTTVLSNDPNVFKAEYEAGFIQGTLQADQIPAGRDNSWDGSYLTDPTHSFPTQLPPPQSQLDQARDVLRENWEYTLEFVRDKAKGDVRTNMRRLIYRLVGIFDGATRDAPQSLPFDEAWLPTFSENEMQITYETPKVTFLDLYYLNTTGDLFNFLPPPGASTPSPASDAATPNPSNCTAFVRKTEGDIFLAHNTWAPFLDQSQALQLWINGDMMSVNAMDPGYLGSGTDFGYNNKGIIFNETTEYSTSTKAKVRSLWTMWRETLAEQYSHSIDKFFEYISVEQSGSYMNGYMIVDAKTDELGYVEMSYDTTVFFKPTAKGVDVSTKPAGRSTAYDKRMITPDYILGFNYPASLLIREQLKAINNRPARETQLIDGIGQVADVESAKSLITYTAPDNPLSIYGRWDLGYGVTTTPQTVPDGSIDAKVVSASAVQRTFGLKGRLTVGSGEPAFWMKFGTPVVNGKPFIWSESQWSDQKLRWVPDVVDGVWTEVNTNLS